MPIRHVVMFCWQDGVRPEQVEAVEAALAALPGAIPEIADYRFGPDLGINEGNFHFVVVADFATEQDYLVYRDHPQHQRVIAEHLRPLMSTRGAVQYRTD